MTGETVATQLGSIITARADFKSDFTALERGVAGAILTGERAGRVEPPVIARLLRYADVLSHSSAPEHRELAYGVIALLREYDDMFGLDEQVADRVVAISEAVLVQLGNFPGLKTLNARSASKYALPRSRGTVKLAKEVLHRTSRGDAVLTDAQYAIAERMRGEDYFSFSGPTSLGKSFILKDALFDIVRRDELNGHCVVVLVPTKALIGQTASDLRELLAEVPDVNVATFPSLPPFLRRKHRRTIFVLTPERLLRYMANPVRDIDYLVVDEAQKIIAENDARSSLYYHAIVEVTRRFAAKLVFSSPSIKNPELFLELFGKATNGALAVTERTVGQQRFFVDLVKQKQFHFSGLSHEPWELDQPPSASDAIDLVLSHADDAKAIVYVNGSAKASELARKIAARLPKVEDAAVAALIAHIQEYVHEDYFLGDTLAHGVAFHHGKMPQEVREKVEAIFSAADSSVRFIVCTSTLLEGVNMPAKTIFVLNDKHGSRNFSKIDFENLVGRAGRLTYDFSGNVVCVREDQARWTDTTQALIPRTDPVPATSFLVKPGSIRKPYTDIARLLRGEALPGTPSADHVRGVRQYASILTLHHIDEQHTHLRSHFLDKVKDGREILRKAASSIAVPADVLRRSPDIAPGYQNAVWEDLTISGTGPLLAANADLTDFDTYVQVLRRLSDLYNWRVEEAKGNDPLFAKNTSDDGAAARLRYWATLMQSWVRGDPLSLVITRAINHETKVGQISYRDYSRFPSLVTEPFDASSALHVNLVIEQTLRDLEGGLRFRIIAYLQNFFDVSVTALGVDQAGINVATLVEYGTDDPQAIELQEIGFSRSSAAELVSGHSDCLVYSDDGELLDIDRTALLARSTTADLRAEVENILPVAV